MLAVLCLAACGSPDVQEPTAEATQQATSEPAPTTTEAPEESPSASSTPASTSAAPTSDSASSPAADGATVLDAAQKGKPLTLADFFRPDASYWEENRFDVADQRDILGISAPISSCGASSYGTKELELRLQNNFEKLTFSAGQANDSESSSDTLIVRVTGNGGQIDTKRIPFNETAVFDVPVTGVNSLKIEVFLDEEIENCGYDGDSKVVLWNLELQ